MNINHYTYRVTWSAEDNEHVGLCAEFPSLSWLAATPEKALAGVRRVVKDVVWQEMHIDCSPAASNRAPPSFNGTAWSTTTAGTTRPRAAHTPHNGCSRRNAARTVRHLAD